MEKINIIWFRRDLRLEDNVALHFASKMNEKLLALFIFDNNILKELPAGDARVSFIFDKLSEINSRLKKLGSQLLILHGDPLKIYQKLNLEYSINKVFTNKDYEPYAIARDKTIKEFLNSEGIEFESFKDQVIFEENEILKDDNSPYTVFTPFKKKWLIKFNESQNPLFDYSIDKSVSWFAIKNYSFPLLGDIGFEKSTIKVKDYQIDNLNNYSDERNFPALDSTSYLSPHLRFGTVSIRRIIEKVMHNESFLSELIWREFFMQILFHFPKVVSDNFRSKYDGIKWRNNADEFEKWKKGETGYPMVDAGMRELNKTGYMHNRVRMVVASFLCKHLLIDWRWGEAYFAEKLLDYELSSNNGNWQWAAGTGCDAAPYFRVFNPHEQLKKFDPELKYIRKWIEDFDELTYQNEMVDHKMARLRALEVYKRGIMNGE